MQNKESAIEVKVGVLVLVALAILAVFVFVLGDCNVSRGFTFHVDFQNAAGLKPGAQVRVAGIPAGTVRRVDFMGGERDESGRPVYVRTTLWVEESRRNSIRQDAEFTITTQGVLGEPYVEVTSLDPSLEPVRDGQVFIGIDPPRLDMIIASAYESLQGIQNLVESLTDMIDGGDVRIDAFINNIGSLAGSLDERVRENSDQIDNIFRNVDTILEENRDAIPPLLTEGEGALREFRQLGRSLNTGVGDGRSVRNIIRNAESVSESLAEDAGPTLASIRETSESAQRILSDNEASIQTTIANAEEISDRFRNASEDVETITGRLARGEGTVGRFLTDEEIFEDMREFVRELKRRPWRIMWKE